MRLHSIRRSSLQRLFVRLAVSKQPFAPAVFQIAQEPAAHTHPGGHLFLIDSLGDAPFPKRSTEGGVIWHYPGASAILTR
jgi:hypothetical protein